MDGNVGSAAQWDFPWGIKTLALLGSGIFHGEWMDGYRLDLLLSGIFRMEPLDLLGGGIFHEGWITLDPTGDGIFHAGYQAGSAAGKAAGSGQIPSQKSSKGCNSHRDQGSQRAPPAWRILWLRAELFPLDLDNEMFSSSRDSLEVLFVSPCVIPAFFFVRSEDPQDTSRLSAIISAGRGRREQLPKLNLPIPWNSRGCFY